MSLDDEENPIGQPSEEVPRIEPDDKCRGKRSTRTDDGELIFQGYCRNPAGKGTDHFGEGRCKFHGGASTGAPKGNQNPLKHALNADEQHYYRNLGPDGKRFVETTERTIVERIQRNTREVDSLDRILARRIAIEIHIVARATDHVINESGLVDQGRSSSQQAALLDEIRERDRDICTMLRGLGAFDTEETQAIRRDRWRDWIEDENAG